MQADFINGFFELGGALCTLLSVMRLVADKDTKGVHWAPALFFMAWGLWNLYYYPALGQLYSFAGGLALVAANAAWFGLMLFYRWRAGWWLD